MEDKLRDFLHELSLSHINEMTLKRRAEPRAHGALPPHPQDAYVEGILRMEAKIALQVRKFLESK